MNDTVKTILSRRSTRDFKSLQIKENDLETILECGINAPSAMNSQDWYFCAIQNCELISQLNEDIKKALPVPALDRMLNRNNGKSDFSVFYNAPTIIVVAGDSSSKWTAINCALATENICIAAQSLEISTCIIGYAALLFDSDNADKYVEQLAIPVGYKPQYAICLGYGARQMPQIARIDGRYSVIR